MLLDIDGIVKISDEFHKTHFGVVVENNDPKKLGRIKVKIDLIYDGSVDELPWVYPHASSPSDFYVPEKDEKVKIIFRNGDIYHPEYIGYYHSTVNHDSTFDADYPDTFGIHKQGLIVRYNMKQELLEVIAKNGSFLKMNKDGDTTFSTTRDFLSSSDRDAKFQTDRNFEVTAQADIKFNAQGKVDINAGGNLTMSSNANMSLSANGNMSVTAQGTATFSGQGGTTVGASGSITRVNGLTVLLGGGGAGVAVIGSQAVGTGNKGMPVISTITTGSTKVFAPLA